MNFDYDPDRPVFRYRYYRHIQKYGIAKRLGSGCWLFVRSEFDTLRHCAPGEICDLIEIKIRLGDPDPIVYYRNGEIITEDVWCKSPGTHSGTHTKATSRCISSGITASGGMSAQSSRPKCIRC